MHSNPTPSLYARLPRLAPLALALALSGAAAAQTITVTGAPGQDGSSGTQPGAAGAAGSAGGPATAAAGIAHTGAVATGGNGGRGGNGAGGAPGQDGGAAGNGGAGGAATAQHIVGSAASNINVSAQATGGNGGAAGVPGEAGNGGSAGAQGAGGNGGDAAASVSATGTRIIQGNAQADGGAAAGVLAGDYARHAGTAEATATLLGGSSSFVSGNVHAYGGNAGMTGGGAGPVAGGAARGAVTATGDIVALSSTVYGGTGSAASGGGAGGRGGDAEGDIHASVGSGYFSGQWRVQGGSGGNSTGGTGGAGGNARLSTQITTATTGSIDLWTYVAGGDGGDGHGLAGDSDVNLVIAAGGLGTVGGEVRSTGGRGGHGAGITGTAMQGGQGKLTANVVTQGRLQLHVSATGGAGGDGIDGHGGRGGDAIAVAAGSGHASYAGSPNELYIEATGGVGGAASAPGKRAGDGGTGHIAGTIHGTGIADAQLRATVTGGRGGTGKGQALAGNGGAAYANNNVDGSVGSDGVELYLEQKAVGGMGGFHDIGKGQGRVRGVDADAHDRRKPHHFAACGSARGHRWRRHHRRGWRGCDSQCRRHARRDNRRPVRRRRGGGRRRGLWPAGAGRQRIGAQCRARRGERLGTGEGRWNRLERRQPQGGACPCRCVCARRIHGHGCQRERIRDRCPAGGWRRARAQRSDLHRPRFCRRFDAGP